MKTITDKIILGTRGSDLALWQSNFVKSKLETLGLSVELKIIKSRGDKDLRPLKEIAGDGFFTKDLENMLLDESIDIAIHSAKDLASLEHKGLPWFAVGDRESTKDIIIYNKKAFLNQQFKAGSRIGTSSPRRKAQCLQDFPQTILSELRGNVPTRLGKVLSGELDAVILAEAGLKRLGLLENLPEEVGLFYPDWVTAPCQGILALQTNLKNWKRVSALANTSLTEIAKIEKGVLSFLGGGCHMAVGSSIEKSASSKYAFDFFYQNHQLSVSLKKEFLSLEDLKTQIYTEIAQLLFANLGSQKPKLGRIVLTHSLNHHLKVYELAKDLNYELCSLPCIEVISTANNKESIDCIDKITNFKNIVFTSQYAVRIFLMQLFHLGYDIQSFSHAKIFCIGESCSVKAKEFGLKVEEPKWEANAKSLFEYLQKNKLCDDLLFIGSDDSKILSQFNRSKLPVTRISVYENRPCSKIPSFEFHSEDIYCFASPSSVRNFVDLYGIKCLENKRIYSIGPSTSAQLNTLGLSTSESRISGSWLQIIKDIEKDEK